jgi:serine/threonine protein kinase
LGCSVGDALTYAHTQGILHRDVKPPNILLNEHGRPKLTDFDLVGRRDTTGGTRTGALGTLLYAAPELMQRPQDATETADVYGLGATAVFLLSGSDLPLDFVRDSAGVIAALPCPYGVKQALVTATMWHASDRFSSVREFCEDLRNGTDTETPPPAQVPASTRPGEMSLARWVLRFISGKYQGGEFPVRANQEIVMGRATDVDMVLIEDMMSRKHAKIVTTDETIAIQDLGSTNGTFVNGEKIRAARLKEGDRILVGTSIIKLTSPS